MLQPARDGVVGCPRPGSFRSRRRPSTPSHRGGAAYRPRRVAALASRTPMTFPAIARLSRRKRIGASPPPMTWRQPRRSASGIRHRVLAMIGDDARRLANAGNLLAQAAWFQLKPVEAGALLEASQACIRAHGYPAARACGITDADCEKIRPAFLYDDHPRPAAAQRPRRQHQGEEPPTTRPRKRPRHTRGLTWQPPQGA